MQHAQARIVLQPLRAQLGLASVAVSTYQAVSGAGIAALDTFLEATKRGSEVQDRLGRPYGSRIPLTSGMSFPI